MSIKLLNMTDTIENQYLMKSFLDRIPREIETQKSLIHVQKSFFIPQSGLITIKSLKINLK